MRAPTYVGCAGWSSPRAMQSEFPAEGTHLVRYAARFNVVTALRTASPISRRNLGHAMWSGA